MSDVKEARGDDPSPFEAALLRFREETRDREPRRASLDDIVDLIRRPRCRRSLTELSWT